MITSVIHLVLILAFVGAIIWLLLFLIEELPIHVRFRRVSRAAVLVIGVLIVIPVLLDFLSARSGWRAASRKMSRGREPSVALPRYHIRKQGQRCRKARRGAPLMLSQHANLGSRSNILSTTPVSACSATPSNATAYRSLLRLQSLPMYGIARDVLKDPNYWVDEPIGEDE